MTIKQSKTEYKMVCSFCYNDVETQGHRPGCLLVLLPRGNTESGQARSSDGNDAQSNSKTEEV